MTRLYVSGPMTGIEGHNFPAFRAAAQQLREAGYDVIDPGAKGDLGWTWEEYLKLDLKLMLDCQGVALLPGWQQSRGAKLEAYVAEAVGIDCRLVENWIVRAFQEEVCKCG